MRNRLSLKLILKEAMIVLPFDIRSSGVGDFYVQMDGNNAVITDKTILLPDYFYRVVEYLYTSGAFKQVIQGTTVPHLNIKGFTDVVVQFFFKTPK